MRASWLSYNAYSSNQIVAGGFCMILYDRWWVYTVSHARHGSSTLLCRTAPGILEYVGCQSCNNGATRVCLDGRLLPNAPMKIDIGPHSVRGLGYSCVEFVFNNNDQSLIERGHQ